MSAPIFNRITLIGLGLIGSSLARGTKLYGLAREIICYDASESVRARAADLQLGRIANSLIEAVKDADCVILCVPVSANAAIAKEIAPHLKAGCILSDVGSVKGAVLNDVMPFLPASVHFIPAHPVAGTEYSGPDAGFGTLFQNRWSILTPPESANPEALATITTFWQGLGAKVEVMSAKHHDLVLALTSHLPHLIAYNIVNTAAHLEAITESEVIKFSAGGFRDFTRIAASDPVMWRDVFLSNKEAVFEILQRFNEELAILTRMIRYNDGAGIEALFTASRKTRKSIIAEGQEIAAPDFGRRGKSE